MKIKKINVLDIIFASVLVLAHVSIGVLIYLSYRYYAIYPSIFGSAVAIVLCLLLIGDIIFFVGYLGKDKILKVVSTVLCVAILAGGVAGSLFVNRANKAVNSVIEEPTGVETFSGTFVCYDRYHKYQTLEDLTKGDTTKDEFLGTRIGLLNETSNGISYIARNKLDELNFDYAEVNYNTNAELLQALIDGDVDAIVITPGYHKIYEADENSNFKDYFDNFIDFYTFEEELKVDTNKTKKNIATEPFNILLIGYSRTDIGSSVGLADSIILATVNPQTFTVSMMSIARDSFVPIACYGGAYDKINSGRSTSRACFIETVENFLGMDIDYYMELDYLGLVQIVNTIGGIWIDNPVDFELDGIYVPKGHLLADGQQALQFCRERHHMPNGDFDRQQHQKEVIIQIAKTMIESRDLSLCLDALEAASDWMSTDLSLNQLTSIFNLILNVKNYTSLDTFNLVDFNTLRMTGSGGLMYYSYSMRLPLWVYLIYQGSYDESITQINNVLGNYETIKQDNTFEFSSLNPYVRPLFYSLSYPAKYMYEPDPMPAYYADLKGETLNYALSWASANGVTLKVQSILPGSAEYDSSKEGLVVSQEPRYGALVSEYPVGTVTVMGNGELDESKQVPSFIGRSYERVIEWANKYGVNYKIKFETDANGEVGKVTSQNYPAYTAISDVDRLDVVVKAGTYTIKFNTSHGSAPESISVTTGDSVANFKELSDVTDGGKTYVFTGWYDSESGGTRVYKSSDITGSNGATVVVYAHWSELYNVTLNYNNPKDSTVTTITTRETLPNPSIQGYNFLGWYNGSTKVTDLTGLTSDVSLIAKWEETEYNYQTSSESEASSYGCSITPSETQEFDYADITLKGNGTPTGNCTPHYKDKVTTITYNSSQATEAANAGCKLTEGYTFNGATVTYVGGVYSGCAVDETAPTPEEPTPGESEGETE